MSTSSDMRDGGWSPTPRTAKKPKVTHDQSAKMEAVPSPHARLAVRRNLDPRPTT